MKLTNELTSQERLVLALVAKGWRNAKIASELFVSTRTVENHLYHIFDKLGVSSRTEATFYALQTGLLATTEMSGNSHDVPDKHSYDRAINRTAQSESHFTKLAGRREERL